MLFYLCAKIVKKNLMITFVSLIIAIILQFVGAIVALGLIKKTKYSLSWIFISIGFLIIAIQRFFEFIPYVWKEFEKDLTQINTLAAHCIVHFYHSRCYSDPADICLFETG